MTKQIEISTLIKINTLNALIQPFRNGVGQICLMSGTVPTTVGQIPNPVGTSTPTTDTLVIWEGDKIFAVFPSQVTIGLSTTASIAIRSGIATWFYGYSSYNTTPNNIDFIGTVGSTGSGADLELGDVNIIQGKTYGIDSIRFTLSTLFSY